MRCDLSWAIGLSYMLYSWNSIKAVLISPTRALATTEMSHLKRKSAIHVHVYLRNESALTVDTVMCKILDEASLLDA